MSTTSAPPARPTTRQKIGFGLVLCVVLTLLYGVPAFAVVPTGAQWGTVPTWTGRAVFAAMAVAQPILMLLANGPRHADRAARVAHPMLGVMWMLFAWSVLTLPLRWLLPFVGVTDPWRSRLLGIGLLVVVAGLAWHGWREAFRLPRVRRQSVAIRGLAADLDGTTIAVLGDTHFDSYDRTEWTERLTDLVNSLAPDVVVHVGDLGDGPADQRRRQVLPLGHVAAAHRFYITGNHEYYSDAPSWLRLMDDLGWTALRNEHRVIAKGGGRLILAGVDDPTGTGLPGHGPDLDAALAGGDGQPTVLLAHQPSFVAQSVDRVDLQLSGHTHGGQIWPFHLLVRLQQPTNQGLSHHGTRTRVWTTRGAGFWGPPFRVFAPSEVSLLTLRTE